MSRVDDAEAPTPPMKSVVARRAMNSVSLGRKMWARQGSNLRPIGYEPTALPLSYEP